MIWNIDVLYVCMCVCMFARARAYELTHKEVQCDCPDTRCLRHRL